MSLLTAHPECAVAFLDELAKGTATRQRFTDVEQSAHCRLVTDLMIPAIGHALAQPSLRIANRVAVWRRGQAFLKTTLASQRPGRREEPGLILPLSDNDSHTEFPQDIERTLGQVGRQEKLASELFITTNELVPTDIPPASKCNDAVSLGFC